MRIIFVDRDGVINKDPGGWTEHSYVTDPKDFHFLPGALEGLRLLKEHGYYVVVVSNQAGVAKGYFTRSDLEMVNGKMLAEVKKNGGDILDTFYCTHRDEDKCECRKPKPGLLKMASRKYRFSARETFYIGDSYVDIIAGKLMGVKTVFVLSGKHSKEEMLKWQDKPDYVFDNLLGAVKWILEKDRRKSNRALYRKQKPRKRSDDGIEDEIPDADSGSGEEEDQSQGEVI